MSTSTANRDRIAFFAGSFNPFTVGHADIVRRSLALFDTVIIAIGINIRKEGSGAVAEANAGVIRALYAGEPRVSVITYSDLTALAAARCGATAIVRGVRSVHDFEYERDMADVNRRISGIDTVLLPADPTLAAVSSSMVRELQAFGLDVSQYLP